MARRRQLKGVAAGVLGHFVSRNNDIDGYWVLGLLYAELLAGQNTGVRIELLAPPQSELGELGLTLAERFRRFLTQQLEGKKLHLSQLRSAAIDVSFKLSATDARWTARPSARHEGGWGEPFHCQVLLTDDLGKRYAASHRGWCGVHAPSRALRSARA